MSVFEFVCSPSDPFYNDLKKACEESYEELKTSFKRGLSPFKVIVFETQRKFQEYEVEKFNNKKLFGEKWFIAFAGTNSCCMALASPSDWPLYDKVNYEEIKKVIKHEFTHRFVSSKIPIPLNEGIAVYFAKQEVHKSKAVEEVKKRGGVPSLLEEGLVVNYNIAPLFIKWLVEKYGEEKLVEFASTDEDFPECFEKIYGE